MGIQSPQVELSRRDVRQRPTVWREGQARTLTNVHLMAAFDRNIKVRDFGLDRLGRTHQAPDDQRRHRHCREQRKGRRKRPLPDLKLNLRHRYHDVGSHGCLRSFFHADAGLPDITKPPLRVSVQTAPQQSVQGSWRDLGERLEGALAHVAEVRQSVRGFVISLPDILFGVDKATLTAEAEVVIAKLTGILLVMPELQILIEGHTDARGSAGYNLKLSHRRAEYENDRMLNRVAAKSIIVCLLFRNYL